MIACVRTDESKPKYAGVMEWNGVFGRGGRPGDWQWLEVEARDMLDNMNAPTVEAPWVGFLLIFNTYTADLGLAWPNTGWPAPAAGPDTLRSG